MQSLLKVLTLYLIAIFSVASEAGPSCDLNAASLEQAVISCMAHEPLLMLQVLEHSKDSNPKETLDFVCSNQDAMVGMWMCLESKLIKCMPDGGNIMADLLPDEHHIALGIAQICKNRKLLTENCMTQEETQSFMQCYVGKVQTILTSTPLISRPASEIRSAMCSIIAADEYCFKLHHGSCSDEFMKEAFKVIEIFFPTDKCPASAMDVKNINGQMKGALGSVLLHGAPLRFESGNEIKYN